MSVVRPLKRLWQESGIASIHQTGRDAYLILLARSCRMFAYGTNSLILAIFFSALEYSDHQIGIFMTLTLAGDVLLGTSLTLIADRVGRRNVLLGGSLLMVLSGIVFAVFENFWILLLAAILGVISVTGGDFGPFRSIEESILSQLTNPSTRSDVLAWYVTTATLGASIGGGASGRIIYLLQSRDGWKPVDAYHALFWIYTAMGLVNAGLVLLLSSTCELQTTDDNYVQIPQNQVDDPETPVEDNFSGVEPQQKPRHWIVRVWHWFSSRLTQISAPTRSIMYKLWFLLAVDSLADGMVPVTLTNYFMDTKFAPSKSTLGDINAVSDFLAAIGSAFAGPLARKIGFVNTMVFTHVPSSASVLLFPFPPTFWMTVGLFFIRKGLNNMDQAPRSAFIAAVVKPEERTAVMGITSMLRTLAATTGPTITGFLSANKQFWIAFVVAGVCRLAYDFGLYAMFVNTELYQYESKPDSSPNGPGDRNLDEEVELQSITSSDTQASDHKQDDATSVERSSKHTLRLPLSSEGVRSRSPHR